MDTTQNTKETDLKSVVYTDAYWCNVAITHTRSHSSSLWHVQCYITTYSIMGEWRRELDVRASLLNNCLITWVLVLVHKVRFLPPAATKKFGIKIYTREFDTCYYSAVLANRKHPKCNIYTELKRHWWKLK